MATTATRMAPQTATPANACTQPPSCRLRTPTEISTAPMPAATPAAVPHASAPWAPCPNSVAPATSTTETTTAAITSTDDGGTVWMPFAGWAATRNTARPPVVRAAPNSSSRSGACRVRIARSPSATTRPTESIGCTPAARAPAGGGPEGKTTPLHAGTEEGPPLPQHPAPPLDHQPQTQAGRRLAALG